MKAREEEDARRLKLVGFDWRVSPRQDYGVTGNPLDRHHTFAITLSTGRLVTMTRMVQYAVYAGVLAGIPTSPQQQLIAAIETAETLHPELGASPVMLEPVFAAGTTGTTRGGEAIEIP